MKQKFYLGVLILSIIWISSCRKRGLELFDDEANSNSIYFHQAIIRPQVGSGLRNTSDPTNYTNFSFGFLPISRLDTTLLIRVQSTGSIRNFDRPYVLVVADSSSMVRGVHYDILNNKFAIMAGKGQDTIKVKLYRNGQLRTKSFRLYLSLKSNENFSTVLSTLTGSTAATVVDGGMINYMISADDMASKPSFWEASICTPFWGPYSLKKLLLYAQVCNLDLSVIAAPGYILNYTQMRAYARIMRTYLLDMQGRGTPVLEENGSPMVMGTAI